MAELKENTSKKTGNSSNTVPILDIVFMTLRHWPWILLSVFICVGIAYFHLLRTPNVYTRSADVLIKNSLRGQYNGDEELSALGLNRSKANIQNEIANLKAKDVMAEVVERLGLDINYYHEGTFHDVVAYGYNLPIRLTLAGFPSNGSFTMKLTVDADSTVVIKDVIISGDEKYSKSFTGVLNDTINTPMGYLMVSPTSAYHSGETVELSIRKKPLFAARDSYNARLGVVQSDEKGSVLHITMADQSAERAEDVINAVIAVYNENWVRDRNQIAVSTSNFINERLGVIEAELGNVDSDISTYKSANLVPDIQTAASMYMTQNQQTQAKILEVNNQLAMARYIRSYLTADDTHNQLFPANSGIQSSNIQTLIGEYNTTLLQRNSLVAKSSEKNPLVAQLDDQLSAQRQAIIRTIDNEIIALDTQLKSLQGTEAQTISRLASNPTQAKNLLSVERQQKVKESLYLFLLQKREENELSQAFTAYNTRIINKPGASGVPVTPNRRKTLLMAFVLGLAIPFGVTFLKESINTKVRGRKDVEHLAVPFLGEIPQYVSKSKGKVNVDREQILVKAGKRNIINEAFRVLRTNVEFMCNATEGSKVIALTSFNPGSGKSFISVNLGMSIALKNRKVLIIDGDMRHGSTSEYVNSPKLGLSNYLSGGETNLLPLIVQSPTCENLNILPIGPIPPNPTELLESPRFAKLIDELKQHFDYIIIDCPPIEVVADAQIIDQYADRTFFIVRAGLLERSMLVDLDRLYEDKKYKNMAFILNGTRTSHGRYGYGYSYRYGYGYGYAYGYNYNRESKSKSK
ncbi:MAG: polysaccharide biosynthesis tyrosine autokinase [Muribaculaceae bacterium]|nr:polysaccharide biosynthesis tyrosine autokinase [Muribaculaceae bacterium]